MPNLKFKVQLHEHITALINKQHDSTMSAIEQQKEGSQGSSSAGDKHNTEGAMQHLELEKKHIQLATIIQNQQTLQKINLKKAFKAINTGALVKSNKGLLYFSIAHGKIKFLQQDIMVISIASPIGQMLKGLKKGQNLNFNEQSWEIFEIF